MLTDWSMTLLLLHATKYSSTQAACDVSQLALLACMPVCSSQDMSMPNVQTCISAAMCIDGEVLLVNKAAVYVSPWAHEDVGCSNLPTAVPLLQDATLNYVVNLSGLTVFVQPTHMRQ